MRFFFVAIVCFVTVVKARPAVDIKTVYYPVSSPSVHELPKRLDVATPVKKNGHTFYGHTESTITWNFWWNTIAGYCRISKVEVTVEVVFTLPKLENSPAEVIALWERWYPKLLGHEKNHMKNALGIAERIEQGLYQLPGYTDCQTLEKNANSLGYNLIEQLSQLDKTYDRETNHGKTEGAWLSTHL